MTLYAYLGAIIALNPLYVYLNILIIEKGKYVCVGVKNLKSKPSILYFKNKTSIPMKKVELPKL